ncbi:Assembly protein G7, partial [Monkeypox virus]
NSPFKVINLPKC